VTLSLGCQLFASFVYPCSSRVTAKLAVYNGPAIFCISYWNSSNCVLLDFLARVNCGPLLTGNCGISILTFKADEEKELLVNYLAMLIG